jgi:hypothetical protein
MKTIHSMRLVAALAVASMLGCSSTTTGPLPPGGPGDTSGAASGASASGASSGGSSGDSSSGGSSGTPVGTSGSSSGQVSGSGSSASGSGATSGSSGSSGMPSTDGGGALPTHGCGQATKCTPGTDLAPPAAADGFQIASPDNAFPIGPNQEAYYCYYKKIPGSATVNVGAFQSWMTLGASHHFILFTDSLAAGGDGSTAGGIVSTGGTGCTPKGQWTYATSTAGQIIELDMPSGVGLPLQPASQLLVFNIHVINTGTTALAPKVKLNVLFAKNATQTAGAMVSYNAGIAVQPGGMQDVTGSCSPPAGSKFFAFTTHVHRHGGSTATGAYTDVNFVPSGGQSMTVVHSTDWENPDVALWNAPDYLTIKSGDQFKYDCHFVNKDATLVTFGETAATGEMCMSIGYYFPAGQPTTGTGVGISNPYCN